MPSEPTEAQKRVFQATLLAFAIVAAAAVVLIFLGLFLGLLPRWTPVTR